MMAEIWGSKNLWRRVNGQRSGVQRKCYYNLGINNKAVVDVDKV